MILWLIEVGMAVGTGGIVWLGGRRPDPKRRKAKPKRKR